MEFGSAHVYLNSSSDEEEYIPEEELEEGIVVRSRSGYAKDSHGLTATEGSQPTSSSLEVDQLETQHSQAAQADSTQLDQNPAHLSDEDQPRPKPSLEKAKTIPLSEESTQPSDGLSAAADDGKPAKIRDLMNDIASVIPAKWRSVGVQLELPVGTLDSIQLEHVGKPEANLRSFENVFNMWKQLAKIPFTWGTIIGILKEPSIGENQLADILEKKYLQDSPHHRIPMEGNCLEQCSGGLTTPNPLPLPPKLPHEILKKKKDGRKGMSYLDQEKEFQEREVGRKQRGVVSRQVDTNVIAITFNTLVNAASVHAGDVVVCSNKNCTAILSHLSKLTDPEGDGNAGRKEWKCEFCGTCNVVELEPEEMPTREETTYLLSPPPHGNQDSAAGSGGVGNTNLIFCIDVSGSMGVTVEVQGKRELRTDEKLRKLGISMQADIGNQYMPGQRRDVTHISRLQTVQNAIEEQMAKLVRICPSQRVGLVAFSDEVRLLGDSKWKEVVVAGDRLEELLRIGNELTPPPTLSQCRAELSKKVSELEEGGQTALGPALLLSVLLAGSIPGSKVIVCTDGLANKGVGNLDVPSDDEAFTTAQQFYTDLGNIAVEKGVTVSLVTIKGVECRILELGRVADATGGNVTIVDPLTVSFEFSNIVSNPIIATNVECKLVLHNRLCFQAEGFNGNVMHASVGNVTSDTEFSFEYKARKSSHGGSGSDPTGATSEGVCPFDTPVMVDGVPHLPFQLLTEYTSKDGSKLLRVVTKLKPVTQERETAEKGIDFGVLGSHSVRTTAALASEGKIMEARAKAISYGRAMTRSSDKCDPHERTKFNAVMSKISPLERQLKATQMNASPSSSGSKYVPVFKPPTIPDSEPQPPFQQGQLAQAAIKSPCAYTCSKPKSFLSPSNAAELDISPIRVSAIASPPRYCLTGHTETIVQRRSATDTLAADLYQCKKMSSKNISQ